jgi:aspartyl-tRNA(Asn)/glutamyl-tRNA(Gln) amidotransferase subunit A
MRDFPDTISALAHSLRERDISSIEVVQELLGRLEDDTTNAFITVTGERALADAARAEAAFEAGEYLGPLHGVPVGLKDLISTKDIRTTMGSALFAENIPNYNATVVEKLGKAGAIVIGKTNTHEFAYGPTGDRSYFGPTTNPYDPERITGGSSGGSGAAVATELCYGALGSDTGGSIRVPAALCGVVGMKPTFGRVSKYGVFPLSWSLDHVGPLTRTVEDNALFLNVIAGYDPKDPYSIDRPSEDFTRDLRLDVQGAVIGVPKHFYFEHVEPEIESKIQDAIEVFRELGAEVREIELPNLHETLSAQRLTLASEAYAVHEERLETAPEKFDDHGLERLLRGKDLQAYRYANAQQTKLRATKDFEHAFEEVDILLAPTTPIPATFLDQRETEIQGHEEAVYSALTRLTGPTDLTGHPSLSVPCGNTSEGLPIGLQLIGKLFDEATTYRFGYAYEKAT